MAVNKVEYNGNTLIDLTGDTVTDAAHIMAGFIGHLADGTQVTGTASGGGCTIDTKTSTPSSNSASISFTGLSERPKMFAVLLTTQLTLATTYYCTGVMSDGTNTYGTYVRRSSGGGSSAYTYVSSSYYSWTYSNGTLTITAQSSTYGGYFRSGYTYRLIYAY